MTYFEKGTSYKLAPARGMLLQLIQDYDLKPEKVHIKYKYMPSNYYRDEIKTYEICDMASQKGLFKRSILKTERNKKNVLFYTIELEKAVNFETNYEKKHDEQGNDK
jgi:hypothetical protein